MSSSAAPPATPSPPSAPPPAAPRRSGLGPLGIGGVILAVIAAVALVGGIGAVVVHLTQRDADGYYMSSSDRFRSAGFALTADGIDLTDNTGAKVAEDVLGHVRVRAERPGGAPVFVGIAATADVDRYLGAVQRSEVTDVNGGDIDYRQHAGGAPRGAPARQTFWNASAAGPGLRQATWKVHSGTWSVVVMNAAGGRPVSAEVSIGAKTSLLLWIGLGLIAIGVVLGGAAGLMISAAGKR